MPDRVVPVAPEETLAPPPSAVMALRKLPTTAPARITVRGAHQAASESQKAVARKAPAKKTWFKHTTANRAVVKNSVATKSPIKKASRKRITQEKTIRLH